MLVVQGRMSHAQYALFGVFCETDILRTGRYVRDCMQIPHNERLFVGYGLWAPKNAIDRAWKRSKWKMWIDAQPVDLAAFGTTDRTLFNYPAAGGKDVTLREWSITLLRVTRGQHTIRYLIRDPDGSVDATWRFTVARPS